MKRTTAFLLALLLVAGCCFALSGCGKTADERAFEAARATPVEGIRPTAHGAGYWFALEGADEPGGINQPIWQIIDWVFYRTAGDLVDAAPDVFTGRVKEISFAVVDDTAGTGLNRLLYTLYTVEVTETCKGSARGTVAVGMPGGIGVRLEEQDEIRRDAGLRPYVLANVELDVGETYLFCTRKNGDRYDHFGMWQFVFPSDSDAAAVIRRVCEG